MVSTKVMVTFSPFSRADWMPLTLLISTALSLAAPTLTTVRLATPPLLAGTTLPRGRVCLSVIPAGA